MKWCVPLVLLLLGFIGCRMPGSGDNGNAPGAPTISSAVSGSGQVTVSWNTVTAPPLTTCTTPPGAP